MSKKNKFNDENEEIILEKPNASGRAQTDQRFGTDNTSSQNDYCFTSNNTNSQNDYRFTSNNNSQNDYCFTSNNNSQNDQRGEGSAQGGGDTCNTSNNANAGDSGDSGDFFAEIRAKFEAKTKEELIDVILAQQSFVMASESKIDELTGLCKRVQADFDNYRRRTNESTRATRQDAVADTVERFLPTLDIFDQAASLIKDEQTLSGIRMMRRGMMDVFSTLGVTEIEAEGKKFDPTLHEAILSEPNEQQSGMVLEVLRKGYKMGEKVVRYAGVKVGC